MTAFQGILLTILLLIWCAVGVCAVLFLWGATWFVKDLGESIAIGYHRLVGSLQAAARNIEEATQNAEDVTQVIEDRVKAGLWDFLRGRK